MQIQISSLKNKFKKNIASKLWTKDYGLKTARGFTLIETLVAITLLVLAITGPLQIAANALNASYDARDEITAYYLAVEGIEYIKNARDSLFLSDIFIGPGSKSYWLMGMDPCITTGIDSTFTGCYVNSTTNFNLDHAGAMVACDTNTGCPHLLYNSSTGFWGYDSGDPLATETKFVRKISVIPQTTNYGQDEAIIKVEITWPSRNLFGASKTFSLTDIMTNWERK